MKNFIIRALSGIVFGVLVIGATLFSPITFAVIFGLIMCITLYEYQNITMGKWCYKGNCFSRTMSMLAAITLFVSSFVVLKYNLDPTILIVNVIPLIGLFVLNLYVKGYNVREEGKTNGYELIAHSLYGYMYIAVPFSLMNVAAFHNAEYNGFFILGMIIILWCTDVGAYLFGSLLGQRFNNKLFPSISPKKSWVGFFGGVFCAVGVGILLCHINFLYLNVEQGAVFSLIIAIFGVFGDLVESQLKRNYGVKDSGTIMPGHGGMLDRFDGALIGFPMAILYLLLFV